jgi:serine/threonine protein kinase
MMAGQVIANRYELGDRLGLGGMSTVNVAFDTRLERYVAVKLLAEHLADDPQFVARFRREALAAARLVHPNIVQVFDFGLDDGSGRHYIVMERIAGPSGAQVLRDQGRLHVDDAVNWIAQACRGLEYAHRNGLVHRDVKPGNLLLSEGDGTIKLADFGIAKTVSEESSITQVGAVLGTAAYLAPEQAVGEEAGPAADIYGLGVVAYQFLVGRLPYEAQSLTELALKQQREEPATLDTLVAAVSPELADAVAIALALDPRERYATARDMGRAITDAMRGIPPEEPATGARGGPATQATSLLATTTRGQDRTAPQGAVVPRQPRPGPPRAKPAAAPAPRASNTGRIWAALFGLLVLAVIVVAVIFATSPASTTIRIHNVVHKDVNQAATSLQELVAENTK